MILPENSLMGYKEDVALALQLHHDRLQARHQVLRNNPGRVKQTESIRLRKSD
jgi:hypothetical protein